jgi:hypothetical protein
MAKKAAAIGRADLPVSHKVIVAIIFVSIPVVFVFSNIESAKAKAKTNTCINNLRRIETAKNQWALENHKTTDDTPTENDLRVYFKDGVIPKCPLRGPYAINSISKITTCTAVGHHI